MLSCKDLNTLQNYCDTLTDPEIQIILDQLIHEYCRYKQSGSPEDCAQRKEWMEMSYEDIRNSFMKGDDLLLTRLKGAYKSSDVVMSEFLRPYRDLLTVSEQRALLEWSGDDEFMEVLDNGVMVEKKEEVQE